MGNQESVISHGEMNDYKVKTLVVTYDIYDDFND